MSDNIILEASRRIVCKKCKQLFSNKISIKVIPNGQTHYTIQRDGQTFIVQAHQYTTIVALTCPNCKTKLTKLLLPNMESEALLV